MFVYLKQVFVQAARDGSEATRANADNFRILFNGQPVALASTQTEYTREQALVAAETAEPSLVLSFHAKVNWNGVMYMHISL